MEIENAVLKYLLCDTYFGNWLLTPIINVILRETFW